MRCPSCAAEVEDGADFCLECGEPLAETAVAAPSPGKAVAAPPAPPAKAPPLRKWKAEADPEPLRCPGCGVRTTRERCPSCGTRLRSADE